MELSPTTLSRVVEEVDPKNRAGPAGEQRREIVGYDPVTLSVCFESDSDRT